MCGRGYQIFFPGIASLTLGKSGEYHAQKFHFLKQ
jgi:hypothetical protein